MAESEAYRKGREIRRQLLGDAYVEQADRTVYTDPMMRKFITAQKVFAEVREGSKA